MSERNFFAELKRRNVYKVAVAYAVVGWLLVQVATQVFPFFEIPNWVVRLVVLLLIVGFPIAAGLFVGVRAHAGGNQARGRGRSQPIDHSHDRAQTHRSNCRCRGSGGWSDTLSILAFGARRRARQRNATRS